MRFSNKLSSFHSIPLSFGLTIRQWVNYPIEKQFVQKAVADYFQFINYLNGFDVGKSR